MTSNISRWATWYRFLSTLHAAGAGPALHTLLAFAVHADDGSEGEITFGRLQAGFAVGFPSEPLSRLEKVSDRKFSALFRGKPTWAHASLREFEDFRRAANMPQCEEMIHSR
ncbi:hypothetical protein [Bradyrhizobium sp. 159]|uniref:hypothetical protein n=1 Tax=Bradyrhizobium sp. 159 TaxID=2782632 RepID=UPI001FF7DA56|nr:hypothetical protein [Bradyrhizobium sp. 159]